ncbi:MAG: hypothetical protein FWD78_02635 [Treponema sp.]|nr:hypothetical protein [Treponema sp.]
MFSNFNIQQKSIFAGNILFIVCCAFYLAWWILAFRPSGAITGVKTGWLLIPASVTGLLGVILAVRGIMAAAAQRLLIPGSFILWGGIVFYFILMAVTVMLFKRQTTTELILIVGWAMLVIAEINALYGMGLFSGGLSAVFLAVTGISLLISLVCYVLYYRLDGVAGYIDGMIPLLLSALVMAAISCFIIILTRNAGSIK